MQSAAGCITFLIILGRHVTKNSLNVMCTYPNQEQHVGNHNHAQGNHMALLGNQRLSEFAVVLKDGKETWTEYVYSPDLEHAAWAGLELSKNRKAILKDVIRIDEW